MKSQAGQGQGPVLTGPLTITGDGLGVSDSQHPLRFTRSKKRGEEGYIFTLFLETDSLTSLERHYGAAGTRGMVAVSFGLSIRSLELLDT